MKTILLLGPGEIGKRNEALKIKKQFSTENIVQLDFKEVGLKELGIQLVSTSLFSTGERLVVAENIADNFDLEKLRSGDESVTFLILGGNPKTDSLLLQSAKKTHARILLFEGEKELTAFPFLDSLIEGKTQAFIELEKLCLDYGGMYILTMIYYLLRRNLLPLPSSSFMQKKIKSQKQKYQSQDWSKFYYQTLKTEFEIKSGIITEEIGLKSLVQIFIGR